MDGEHLSFELPDLDGELVSADDPRFAGKVLLVDIWGTWCAPCLSELPVFLDLQEKYGDRGLVIIAIAFERVDPEERTSHLREFREKHGINFLVLEGGTPGQVMEKLPAIRGFKGFPVEILMDRQGKVRTIRNGRGYSKRWARKLDQELAALLNER